MKALLPLLVLLVACAPDIPQDKPPAGAIVVDFDLSGSPPVVPLPNDLAIMGGKIVVPASPTDSPAQSEFNQDYLETLGGFPFESTASVTLSGALNPATVNANSVLGIDVTAGKTNPSAPLVALAPAYDMAHNTIAIPPPAGGWTRAHQYAVALVAGPKGLKGAAGEDVIGSSTWELVSGQNPLVKCPQGDLTSKDCTLAVDIIPSTLTDPGARLQDQMQKALQLETIRAGYAPLVQLVADKLHLQREQIPIVWTFTIVDAGEVTFDPANSVIPFPNDILRDAKTSTLALPNPKTGKPLSKADCMAPTDQSVALYCGLNTLDGFSTVAPPLSDNSNTADAVAQAHVDGATLVANMTVGLQPIASTAPAAEQSGPPNFKPCLNCLSSTPPAGQPAQPEELQWQLVSPLDEKTTYLAWVSGDVKDKSGKNVIASPTFALLRLANPLVDPVTKHATVNILTDAQAAQLEPLRSAMKPVVDKLATSGVPRKNLTLAWTFTTQSEGTILDQLYGYPALQPKTALTDTPVYVFDATAPYQQLAHLVASGGTAVPSLSPVVGNIVPSTRFLVGVFMTPVAVTGPSGTLNPYNPKYLPVNFTLVLPSTSTAMPQTGYPLTIFGHGITRSREDFLALAAALASPVDPTIPAQAVIAMDTVYHGERTSCTGSAANIMQMSDDAACADPMNQKCNEAFIGRCVARDTTKTPVHPCNPGTSDDYTVCAVHGQGACVPSTTMGPMGEKGVCEGGDFLRDDYKTLSANPDPTMGTDLVPLLRPVISGWNMFSLTNFFGTRDNFRQQVIDLSQLVRVIKSTTPVTSLTAQATAAAGAPVSFDTTRLGYVGQSLGGILGTLFNAVSPDTTNVVLNVPGGDLPQIVLQGAKWATTRAGLLQTLQGQGILVGTPAYDQFINTVQWVLDAADPANLGWRLTHPVVANGVSAPNANRKAFIQFIDGDETVPNFTNFALVTAADRPFVNTPPSFGCTAPLTCYEFTGKGAIDGDMFDTTSAPTAQRHTFLLWPPTMAAMKLTNTAQSQAAKFLALGHL